MITSRMLVSSQWWSESRLKFSYYTRLSVRPWRKPLSSTAEIWLSFRDRPQKWNNICPQLWTENKCFNRVQIHLTIVMSASETKCTGKTNNCSQPWTKSRPMFTNPKGTNDGQPHISHPHFVRWAMPPKRNLLLTETYCPPPGQKTPQCKVCLKYGEIKNMPNQQVCSFSL